MDDFDPGPTAPNSVCLMTELPLGALDRPLLALCVLPSYPAFSSPALWPDPAPPCSPDRPQLLPCSCHSSCLDITTAAPIRILPASCHVSGDATSSENRVNVLLVPPTRGARRFDWTAPVDVSCVTYVLFVSICLIHPTAR